MRDAAWRQYATSYLINGTVAIDAGCLGFCGTPQEHMPSGMCFLLNSRIASRIQKGTGFSSMCLSPPKHPIKLSGSIN